MLRLDSITLTCTFLLSLRMKHGLVVLIALLLMNSAQAHAPAQTSFYDFVVKDINGHELALSSFKGKVVLVVNVASHCGYTPQYKGLEALYRKYKDKGLVVLGFPANNFGAQEPGTDAEIKSFCSTTYDVSFPMCSKISVLGDDMHPLYRMLTADHGEHSPQGDIKWNFEKFLISKTGAIIGRYHSNVTPENSDLVRAIESALGS